MFWNGTWGDECYNEAFSPSGKGVIPKQLLYLALVFFPIFFSPFLETMNVMPCVFFHFSVTCYVCVLLFARIQCITCFQLEDDCKALDLVDETLPPTLVLVGVVPHVGSCKLQVFPRSLCVSFLYHF